MLPTVFIEREKRKKVDWRRRGAAAAVASVAIAGLAAFLLGGAGDKARTARASAPATAAITPSAFDSSLTALDADADAAQALTTDLLDSRRDQEGDDFLDRVHSAYEGLGRFSGDERMVEATIKSGDTLSKALARAGADNLRAHNAASAMGKLTNLRRLKPGQKLSLWFDAGTGELSSVKLEESVERTVVAHVSVDGKFTASEQRLTYDRELVRARATIRNSLSLAASRAGLEPAVTAGLIRIFSFDVDFQRDIHPGDGIELTYERFVDEDGRVIKTGAILKATMIRRGKALTYYRYQPKGHSWPGYFDAKGRSSKKTLMQTPVDGARISSGYGKRRHPILGYNKMHRGVDFAARSGTPIMAAGDGVIEALGWNGSYGRYIRIRHNGSYKTAYAHLRGYRGGLKRGSRVRQGQIIGYVGSSGRSTGPHLHYEVIHNGRQVNPRSIRVPTGVKLKGEQLTAFKTQRARLDGRIDNLPWLQPPQVAGSGGGGGGE